MKMKILSVDRQALKVDLVYYDETAGVRADGAPKVSTVVIVRDIPLTADGRPVSAAELEKELAKHCPHHELAHRAGAVGLPKDHDISDLMAMVGKDFDIPAPSDTQLDRVPATFRAPVR